MYSPDHPGSRDQHDTVDSGSLGEMAHLPPRLVVTTCVYVGPQRNAHARVALDGGEPGRP